MATAHVSVEGEQLIQPPKAPAKAKRKFRPPGAPAGTWAPDPWWHSAFLDRYESVCVWSHAVPGLGFLVSGVLIYTLGLTDKQWQHDPLGIFLFCAATTHFASAGTHVYPDYAFLEKLDHVGIVATILGTPMTAVMAHTRGGIPLNLKVTCMVMIAAAMLPPTLRVLGFIAGITAMLYMHAAMVLNWNLAVQLALYLAGAYAFLRNKGHSRWPGLADHHFLHYASTIASVLHVVYLRRAMRGDQH